MAGLKSWVKRPRIFWIIGVGLLVVILLLGVFTLIVTQAAPPQPFPYTHTPHIENGIPCLYCHASAYRSQSASLPTKAKCMGCHNNIKPETPLLKQLDEYAKAQENFEWVPVALMPDYVYFNHQSHLNASLDCINCHGDVSKMTAAQPQKYWNMGWCLDCHKKMAPDDYVKLSDCSTCHK
jgi:hypothetical protein